MRLLQTEYLIKGAYLGLILFAALVVGHIDPDTGAAKRVLLTINLVALLGLAAALFLAALVRLRQGFRIRGRVLPFVLFLLLESPTLAYVGVLGGTVAGLYLARNALPAEQAADMQQPAADAREPMSDTRPRTAQEQPSSERPPSANPQKLFLPLIAGGAVVGLVFGLVRQMRNRMYRLILVLGLAVVLVVLGLAYLGIIQLAFLGKDFKPLALVNPDAFAVQLLLSLPFFYILTFSGHEEESEVEVGAMSGLLGLGLFILIGHNQQMGMLAVLLPLVLFFGYTLKVMPGLRVLKHAFRGLGHARAGKFRRAMQSFRRALQLDPNNRVARSGFWEVHLSLDLDEVVKDPQLMALLDLDMCLDRAGGLLLSKPGPAQLDEAQRLLQLVIALKPDRQPQVDYWRAVAAIHAQDLDRAATLLEHLLDPAHYGHDNPARQAILLSAWQLALLWHPELRRRVGEPQLAEPGRRMEAIAAVERYLADNPDDAGVVSFKKMLYHDLTEAEYDAGAGAGLAARHFDHDYVQQLGLSLINNDEHWQRGGEYLRLAARGMPMLGPTLFVHIAQAQQRAGLLDDARHNFELAKRAGQSVGPKNLAEPERLAYFSTVKHLGEDAMGRGDLDAAIENYRLYSESERSGVETLRILADLYERRGDPLAAARVTDQALQYNAKDKDLLERKDRYYYSIMPSDLKARLEHYGYGFDVDYCLRKSRSILDGRYTDLEWLDVAHHLTQLALVIKPESLAAKMLLARVLLRLGEKERAVAILEEVRGPQKPERFASKEDEEGWYQACQLLGDLYLELDRADLAIPCLNDFRKSSKAGARTWYKLGQAYEALGNRNLAVKCYQQVTGYEGNPLAPDAHDALARLQG
jgi:tetratricopeptide (TPR) repeat protein